MAIEEILMREFNGFSPARSAMAMDLTEEVSCHADTARNIIGALFLEKNDNDWGFVILGRDPRGAFRAIEVTASIEDQEEASEALLAKMRQIEASGETVFAQDPGD